MHDRRRNYLLGLTWVKSILKKRTGKKWILTLLLISNELAVTGGGVHKVASQTNNPYQVWMSKVVAVESYFMELFAFIEAQHIFLYWFFF